MDAPLDAGLPGRVDQAVAIRMAVLAVLFAVAHARIIDWLWQSWGRNINWSHGYLIPLFSLYLVYARWGDIQRTVRKAFWPGLVILVAALVAEIFIMAVPTLRNFSLWALAMVAMLFGLVLYLGGSRLIRLLWLPVLYLVLAVPAPKSVYTKIALPLQELAASGAVVLLKLCGVQIVQKASSMTLISRSGVSHQLTVAEACSGMHLLMAFFALGVATAYLETRPIWQRVVLVLAALPIAVFCNVLRVTITCTMYYIDKKEWGQGFLHSFTGMIMLIPAFAMLWALGWVLNRLFLEDNADDEEPAEGDAATEVGS